MDGSVVTSDTDLFAPNQGHEVWTAGAGACLGRVLEAIFVLFAGRGLPAVPGSPTWAEQLAGHSHPRNRARGF